MELVRKFSEDMETMLHRKVEAIKVLQVLLICGGFFPRPCHTEMTLTDVVALHPLTHIILFLPHEFLPCVPISQKILAKEEMM